MKINGPSQTNLNPYKQVMQRHEEMKKDVKQDQLEISAKAKQLQESEKTTMKRDAYVQQIKNEIDSGTYKINYGTTAQKMIDFWSKQ